MKQMIELYFSCDMLYLLTPENLYVANDAEESDDMFPSAWNTDIEGFKAQAEYIGSL